MSAKKLAVTGHRRLPRSFDRKLLEDDFRALLAAGYREFYIGMALGFDTECFLALGRLKAEFPDLRRVACVPCAGQDGHFTEGQKRLYREMLKESEEAHRADRPYGAAAMMARNRFMVDSADALFAFLERRRGGSYNTVRYCRDREKPVIFYGFSRPPAP